jgi:hypothetical protein
MNLGGPVWHASVAARGFPIWAVLEAECERQLADVGDALLGEWRERGERAFHLRRRLSAAEQRAVGPVADIRRQPEAVLRASRLGPWLTLAPPEVLEDEIGRPA